MTTLVAFIVGYIAGAVSLFAVWVGVCILWCAMLSTNMQAQRRTWWYRLWRRK